MYRGTLGVPIQSCTDAFSNNASIVNSILDSHEYHFLILLQQFVMLIGE